MEVKFEAVTSVEIIDRELRLDEVPSDVADGIEVGGCDTEEVDVTEGEAVAEPL